MTRLSNFEIIIAFLFNFSIITFMAIVAINQFEQSLRTWYVIIIIAFIIGFGPAVMTIWVMMQIKK